MDGFYRTIAKKFHEISYFIEKLTSTKVQYKIMKKKLNKICF